MRRLYVIERLKRRAEFLAVRGGVRWSGAAFLIEAKPRVPADEKPPRFGFTVTKKLGGAVVRNRMRRRLREALRLSAPRLALAGTDYVVVARPAALDRPFADLQRDFESAFNRLGRSARGESFKPSAKPTA